MDIAETVSLFQGLKDKKICVVGDFIVDHNRLVKGKRLSPEAPIPIVEPEIEEFRLGGAGNVANNLRALGVGNAFIITVLGSSNYCPNDFSAHDRELLESPGIIFEEGRLTTVKERVITRRQQIVRIDTQSGHPIKQTTVESLIGSIKNNIGDADAVVFSDYAHGVCVPSFIKTVMAFCIKKSIPTVVDSKAKDAIDKYMGATVAIPNTDEARLILHTDETDEMVIALNLLAAMKLQASAITLGPEGVLLAANDGTVSHYPALNRDPKQEVVDVTGAGDTVAAIVAIGLVLNLSYDSIFKLAMLAAGIKVNKRGVAVVTPQEIVEHGMILTGKKGD